MERIENQVYINDPDVILNGKFMRGCEFISCTVFMYKDGLPCDIQMCIFCDCEQLGDGWPKPFLVVDIWR